MKKSEQLRLIFFIAIIGLFSAGIIYRLFILSYVQHAFYAQTAQAQTERVNNVSVRGNVYFTDKDNVRHLAAANKKFPVVAIRSSHIEKNRADEIVADLADITGMEQEIIAGVLHSGSDYARVLPRRLDNKQVESVRDLGASGVTISYEADRYYPFGPLGADTLGFLGYSGDRRAGQYGIESFYDQELAGRQAPGSFRRASGILALLSKILPGDRGEETVAATPETDQPKDLVLTIDKNIQTFVEEQLDAVLQKWNASGGSVVVQDPATGKILAMADRPSFDSNNYRVAEQIAFLNRNVQEIFEPGSSFKPVTMAAGLDLAKITPATVYEDTGVVEVAGRVIRNFSDRVFGRQTMTQVLENSVNTGVMFVENLIGDDAFLNYVINFGFGQRTGIDLPGEISGDISNLYSGRKVNYLTSSFGQGIAVTPIQLINAYSAIANGGRLMKPYLVDRIVTQGGGEIKIQPETLGIPISEKTAAKLRSMLVSVVDNGFDKARIKGYDIAGKTGTAQVADAKGGYEEDAFIHNFLGFAPASNPRFTVMIKMDRPQGIAFAADSLSPVFRNIVAFLLNYYTIPPTRK